MKKAIFLLPLIAIYIVVTLSSNTSGPAGSGNDVSGARGGAGCNNGGGCHGAASTSTTITLSLDSAGVAVNHYIAGNTYNITVKGVNTSSTSLPAYGFTVAAVKASGAGTPSATDGGTLATSGLPAGCVNRTVSSIHVVEHNGPISPASGSGGSGTVYTRSIPWTAPATGSGNIVLYGVVNAVNLSSSSSGDKWNWTNLTVPEFFPSVRPIIGAGSLCAGTTLNLYDSTPGGTWSSGNPAIASISSTGVVYGVSGGTAIVSYSTTTLGTDTAIITVNPLPVSGTVYGGTNMCVGSSYVLASTSPGGTWSSTAPTVVSIASTTGRVYGVSNGTATIIYRVNNVCGSSYSYNNMTVASGAVAGTMSGATSFCEGFSAQLYRATGTGGGSWSTSTTSIATIDTNGRVYGISRGNAIITYSVSTSCGTASVMDTFTVLPSPPAIMGPSIGCVGATVTLTDSVPSGIWRGTNPSVAAVAAGFGTVRGITPGVDTIIYTAPTGCVARHVLTIYPTPGAISGTLSACPGSASVLSNPTPGGIWRTANASIASISTTGIVTAVSTNTTTISYVMPVSGCNATTNFIVHPVPSFIQGNNSFCANSTDTLFNLTSGGIWTTTPSSVAVIDGATGVMTGVGGGTASVTYTLPAGCYVTRPITVHPTPNPTITINWAASSFHTQTYFVSYQWYLDGVTIPGGTTPTVGAPYNGNYTVTVVDTFGCESTSSPYNFTQVGIDNLTNAHHVAMYPNPASEIISVDAPMKVYAIITDLTGKVVLRANDAKQIDIRNLLPGSYIMQLRDENGALVADRKFTKR